MRHRRLIANVLWLVGAVSALAAYGFDAPALFLVAGLALAAGIGVDWARSA